MVSIKALFVFWKWRRVPTDKMHKEAYVTKKMNISLYLFTA